MHDTHSGTFLTIQLFYDFYANLRLKFSFVENPNMILLNETNRLFFLWSTCKQNKHKNSSSILHASTTTSSIVQSNQWTINWLMYWHLISMISNGLMLCARAWKAKYWTFVWIVMEYWLFGIGMMSQMVVNVWSIGNLRSGRFLQIFEKFIYS
jgi:hypothetical protein